MIVYPEIELSGGKCVSLERGRMDKPIVFDDDPLETALLFQEQGAQWIHVTDLDAAAKLEKDNTGLITRLIESVDVPVQVGGGIRTLTWIDEWFNRGADRVVIGTLAVKDPHTVKTAIARHPKKILISVDAKAGKVVAEGWTEESAWTPLEFARQFEITDVAGMIFTDIDRSADLPESSFAATTELAGALTIPVISSGLIKSLDDISVVRYLPNISGCLTCKALFSKMFTLREAIEIAHSQ